MDNYNDNTTFEFKIKNRIDDNYQNFWHYIKTNWKTILIIIGCTFFYAFGQVHFLIKAAIVSDGVEAISISLANVIPVLKPYLTILYLLLNIPLILIFFRKVKKSFMISTMIFLFFNALFGFIFGLEPVDNFISQKIIVIMPDGWELSDKWKPTESGYGTTNYVQAGWPVFVYAALAVTCCSPTSAIIWKVGSSTGGTDLIAYYMSTKLKKEVGNFLMIVGSSMALSGIITLYFCTNYLPVSYTSSINGFNNILGPQTIGTFLYVFLNAFIINLIYPKYQKVTLRIDTTNAEEVENYLKKMNFWHPYKVKTSISGYTKEKIYSIETIVLLLESDEIASKIKKNIPGVWISIVPVSKIYGRFDYPKID